MDDIDELENQLGKLLAEKDAYLDETKARVLALRNRIEALRPPVPPDGLSIVLEEGIKYEGELGGIGA